MTLSMCIIHAVWLLTSLAYILVFRMRKVQATSLTCLIVAGAPLLLALVPLPLPWILGDIAGIGLAIYLTMHYTGVPLIPDGLFIPLGIEIFFRAGVWGVQLMT